MYVLVFRRILGFSPGAQKVWLMPILIMVLLLGLLLILAQGCAVAPFIYTLF